MKTVRLPSFIYWFYCIIRSNIGARVTIRRDPLRKFYAVNRGSLMLYDIKVQELEDTLYTNKFTKNGPNRWSQIRDNKFLYVSFVTDSNGRIDVFLGVYANAQVA